MDSMCLQLGLLSAGGADERGSERRTRLSWRAWVTWPISLSAVFLLLNTFTAAHVVPPPLLPRPLGGLERSVPRALQTQDDIEDGSVLKSPLQHIVSFHVSSSLSLLLKRKL